MAQLDIIITHYNEPWQTGRTMFEMLRMQRLIRKDAFRVILVQDGPDEELDLQRMMRVYPFIQKTAQIPHGGVSAARNEGLAMVESPWVMFCDFDDTFLRVDSLRKILECIAQAGDRADILYSDFIEEVSVNGKMAEKTENGHNKVFIHGKCWRRAFLIEHDIRFDESLSYSEDALFNEIAWMESVPERRAKMPEPVYVWCLRAGSLSNDADGNERRADSLYRKRLKTIAAFRARGREYDAKTMAVRAMIEFHAFPSRKLTFP